MTRRATNAANEETPNTGSSGYDLAGNMVTLQSGKSAIYDAWNRLVEVDSGSSVVEKYQYDGAGRRVQTFTNFSGGTATVTDDYLSGQQVVESDITTGWNLSSGGGARAGGYQYLWSPRYIDAPVLRDTLNTAGTAIVAASRIFYLGDANYNVTAILGQVSGNWQVVERYTYDAYGVATIRAANWATISGNQSQYGNTILSAGRMYSYLTNLYFNRARYYDAGFERFVNRDPIAYRAGDFNLYRYVHSNPTNRTDPSGLLTGVDLILLGPYGVIFGSLWWAVGFDATHNGLTVHHSLTNSEQEMLAAIQREMSDALSKCNNPNAAAIAAAIRDCPIIGMFVPGGVGNKDGGNGSSYTAKPPLHGASVILGSNFFKKPRCDQYVTLCKECYLRVVLGNYDDTGNSDRALDKIFEPLEECLGCVGHTNPSKLPPVRKPSNCEEGIEG